MDRAAVLFNDIQVIPVPRCSMAAAINKKSNFLPLCFLRTIWCAVCESSNRFLCFRSAARMSFQVKYRVNVKQNNGNNNRARRSSRSRETRGIASRQRSRLFQRPPITIGTLFTMMINRYPYVLYTRTC